MEQCHGKFKAWSVTHEKGDMVEKVEKLSVAERKRSFYKIDFSPDCLGVPCESLKISARQKTCDMSDDPRLPLIADTAKVPCILKLV